MIDMSPIRHPALRKSVILTKPEEYIIIHAGAATAEKQPNADEIAGFVGDLIDLGLPGTGKSVSGVLEKIPDNPESDENSNEILRSAAQYATNFIPLMRGLRIASAIPKMGKTVQSATAGMLTAFSALDVDTPKFGEMIESLHPKLKLPLLDFLKSNPDDSNAEKRFKNST